MSNIEARTLAQNKLINIILRSKSDGARHIASILETNSVEKPCLSSGCLLCGIRFQQAAVSVVERFIGVPSLAFRGRMTTATIIPPSGCVAPDALSADGGRHVAAEISAALEKLNLPPIVMGLKISFNESLTGKVRQDWCIYPHDICLAWLCDAQIERLQAEFPGWSLVNRPVLCIAHDNNIAGIRYANKPDRFRRVTFLEIKYPTRKPFRDTQRRPLRLWQGANLANVEHQLGFDWRLLTHGINREAVRQHLAGLGWPRDGPGWFD